MPVRPLTSSVLKWPDEEEVTRALTDWAVAVGKRHPEVDKIGYFGSYARGDWGVGSDLDVLVIVGEIDAPFERRGSEFSALELPVQADIFVYTRKEWELMQTSVRNREARWIYQESGSTS